MAVVRFIDANVLLRALTGSEPAQAAASRGLLLRVEAGEEKVTTSSLVLFEVVFTLHSKRSYNLPKERVVELMIPVVQLRGLQIENRTVWESALALWLSEPVDFTDAYNVATMRSKGIADIYAWDRGYRHFADINRVEPVEISEEAA